MRLLKKVISSILLVIFVCIASLSQISHDNLLRTTTEKSYITFGGDVVGNLPPLLFEAKITHPIYMRFKDQSRFALSFRPSVIMRMKISNSFPIINPSYFAEGKLRYKLKEKAGAKMKHFHLSFTHHSNGQEEVFLKQGIVNYAHGNFTVNDIEIGYNVGKPIKIGGWYNFQSFSAKTNIDLIKDLYFNDWYPNHRVNYKLQLFNYLDNYSGIFESNPRGRHMHIRFDLSMFIEDFTTERLKSGHACATSLMISYKPIRKFDFSFFVQAYWGEDYYNIHFVDPTGFIRFGIISDASKMKIF